jgi:hypothetical protein
MVARMASLFVLAATVAVAAATRSSWSPCGLSMWSSITPLAERARGRRFGWTAAWFVAGSILGGATLGLGAAVLAAGVARLAPGTGAVALVAAGAALAGTAWDAGLLPPALPHHRRQVNELWLNRYRGWVYGLGFGWQIGSGLATYVMTAGVYLSVVLAALTGAPVAALVVGVFFGLVRGLAILPVAVVTSPARLAAFHRRVDAAREPVRVTTLGSQAVVAVAAASLTGSAGGAALVAVAAAGIVLWARRPARAGVGLIGLPARR